MNQILQLLDNLEKSQWWTQEEIHKAQLIQVQNVIRFSKNIPFYKERLAPFAELLPFALTAQDLEQVPILTRRNIQESREDIIAPNPPPGHTPTYDVPTSGSTGMPIKVKATPVTSLCLMTLTTRGHLWHKRDFSCKNVTIKTLKDKVDVKKYGSWVPGFKSGPALVFDVTIPINRLYDMVLDEDPEYLHTHPTTIREMLKRSIEIGIKPKKLREIRTMGEILEDELRETCLSVWGVPMVDIYSSEEVNTISHQCPDHNHAHVQAENVMVEIVDDEGKACKPGEIGRVIITTLMNYAMPLIRYEILDYAEVGEPCSCGRGLPVIKKIVGRSRGMATAPNGKDKFFPVFATGTVLTDLPIIQHRIIQKSLNDMEIRLVVERHLDKNEKDQLIKHFTHNFGYPFNFSINYVDELDREKSGKYEFFISELDT